LERTPRRVEVFDNSHIMGAHAVGAMIVAGPDGFEKNQYRKFNIKTEDLAPGDDYAMMREVLGRRFRRLVREHGLPAEETAQNDAANGSVADFVPAKQDCEVVAGGDRLATQALLPPDTEGGEEDAAAFGGEQAAWPDLVLIDGGAGQLSAAQEVFAQLGLHGLSILAIAKGPDRNAGRERFFMPGKPSFTLGLNDPVLYFVQRLRDEAHRFAIGSHRTKRKKAMGENALDGIPGIGPARKRALLKHFGSAKSVSRAGLADLQAVAGISAATAQQVYDYFHDRR
jgi:excinuclease ABC subunit C